MPPFRHTASPARRRPLLAVLAVGVAAAGLAGCAAETGTRDGGVAPSLAPPVSASPLWPQSAPSAAPPADDPSPAWKRYRDVDGVVVPAGGLRNVPAKELLEKDPNVPKLVLVALTDCPGSRCGLRKPVYRDLTGDGRDELVVALDEPSAGLTLIHVYVATGDTVRPVLISWGPLGLTGETFGHDLVLTSTDDNGRFTTRYRWNGAVMATTPEDQAGATPPERTAPPQSPGTPTGPPVMPQQETPR